MCAFLFSFSRLGPLVMERVVAASSGGSRKTLLKMQRSKVDFGKRLTSRLQQRIVGQSWKPVRLRVVLRVCVCAMCVCVRSCIRVRLCARVCCMQCGCVHLSRAPLLAHALLLARAHARTRAQVHARNTVITVRARIMMRL